MKRLIIRERTKMIVVKKAINGPTSSSFRHQLNGGIVVELKFSDTVCDCISSKSVLFMIYSPSVCSNVRDSQNGLWKIFDSPYFYAG